MTSNCPISTSRLRQICDNACDSALTSASAYEHSQTQSWNNSIINDILKGLISESTSTSSGSESESESPTKYKFCVNSTIIQHTSDPRPIGVETDAEESAREDSAMPAEDGQAKKVGRRGMHSASGAYWNNEKDGMWSHKYEGGEAKGMDIVVSVMWIAV